VQDQKSSQQALEGLCCGSWLYFIIKKMYSTLQCLSSAFGVGLPSIPVGLRRQVAEADSFITQRTAKALVYGHFFR
jgi:hypothetical protein